MNYAPVFTALLGSIDEVAKGFLVRRLQPELPVTVEEQKAWFAPYLGGVDSLAKTQRERKSEDYISKTCPKSETDAGDRNLSSLEKYRLDSPRSQAIPLIFSFS
ncbi:hypothetical protein [Fischerella thermalis]|uniref:hypothetical protein n=1 Tax=Fischerella thermalis TaxID=372787 RepID=UPI00242D6986|nr:hypothetical protein [Fischerella thermalis]